MSRFILAILTLVPNLAYAQVNFDLLGASIDNSSFPPADGTCWDVDSLSAATRQRNTFGRAIEGLAFDPATNTTYATEPFPTTGNSSRLLVVENCDPLGVGMDIGHFNVRSLAFDTTNNLLYGVDRVAKSLLQIDTATGAGTPVASVTPEFIDSMAYDPERELLFAVDIQFTNDNLWTIDPQTGANSLVGPIGFEDVGGLTYRNGQLFGSAASGELITVDPTTGQGQFVGTLPNGEFRALTTSVHPDEPYPDIYGKLDANAEIILHTITPGDIVEMAGLDFLSPQGLLVPDNNPSPFTFALANTADQVTLGNLGSTASLSGQLNSGVTYSGSDPFDELDAFYGVGPSPRPFNVYPFLDCNLDGVVTDADLLCGTRTGTIDPLLRELGIVKGDIDLDGSVAFPDFLTLSANFGVEVQSYLDGDLDGSGDVAFADFLILSENFGQQTAATTAAVPEPENMAGILAICVICTVGRTRARRR